MNRKRKGCNTERELVHLFHDNGWAPLRVAGSGSSTLPSPDIIAGNGFRVVAIEAKSSKGSAIYIPINEVDQLLDFSKRFGAEAWIAVRFNNEQWYFVDIPSLKKSERNYAISTKFVKEKGQTFSELIRDYRKL